MGHRMSEWSVVIASGPSLTRADCDALRGIGYTIAINNAVVLAPWADELFAGDGTWWRFYGPKVAWFKGRRVSKTFKDHAVERWRSSGWPRTGNNSGHMGIQRAVDRGARNIAIIGFDQSVPKDGPNAGKKHYHGDHPQQVGNARTKLGNAEGIADWPRMMALTARDLQRRRVRVVNLSRETALKCFPRVSVEEFLGMARVA